MRTGLWVSGAGGSGVLIAKKPDGSWSPPSGILLHTAGLGFLVGVDIYDCVVVINTEKAMEAFTKVRCTLGTEISVAAGPVGAGGVLDTEVHKRQSPIYTYLKSRGFYAGVQIDGTIVIERFDENERFYGQKLPVKDILEGKVRHPPYEIKRLMETIKAAQGDADFDASMIPEEAPPGDYDIEDGTTFGVPDKDDPDPYGVLALEKEGMSLKEAGTKKRASWEEFTFSPSPSSPIHSLYARASQDNGARSTSRRNSWRTSAFSNVDPKTPSSLRNSMDQARSPVIMADSSTQTDLSEPPTSDSKRNSARSVSHHSSKNSLSNGQQIVMQDVPENEVLKTERAEAVTANGYTTPPRTPPLATETSLKGDTREHDDADDEDEFDDEDVHIVEPVMQSVHTVQPVTTQAINRARVVDVRKPIPPKLPPRNPGRGAGPVVINASPRDTSPEKRSSTDIPSVPSVEHEGPTQESLSDARTEKISEQLDTVRLDDEEDDLRPNPWAQVEEVRKHEEQKKTDDIEAKMPGGFD